MILAILIAVLLIGGFLVLAIGQRYPTAARWLSLLFVTFDFVATIIFWSGKWGRSSMPTEGTWLADLNWNWIPSFGIRFHLAIDGFSLPLIALTFLLGIMAVLCSWKEIQEKVGFFHFNLLFVQLKKLLRITS